MAAGGARGLHAMGALEEAAGQQSHRGLLKRVVRLESRLPPLRGQFRKDPHEAIHDHRSSSRGEHLSRTGGSRPLPAGLLAGCDAAASETRGPGVGSGAGVGRAAGGAAIRTVAFVSSRYPRWR